MNVCAVCDGADGPVELTPGTEVTIGPKNTQLESDYMTMNYRDDESCLWTATGPPGSFIRLDFLSFIVEGYCPKREYPPTNEYRDQVPYQCSGIPCTDDYVSVYDGPNSDSPRIAKVHFDPSWEIILGYKKISI